MAHVIILGGGFGGLAAAHELRTRQPDLEISLVARDETFFMGFAKLWDLGGQRPLAEGTRQLTYLEHRDIDVIIDSVTAIDPATRTVTTAGFGSSDADGLIVALGAGGSPQHLAFLEAPNAFDLYSARSLPGIHARLAELTGGRLIVSILGTPLKCPPAPFEAALTLHARLQREERRDAFEVLVTTPMPTTLPVAGPDASAVLAERLEAEGVPVRTGAAVMAVDGASQTITFEDGSTEHYDLWLGVPACAPPPLARASSLAGPSGWIEPDPRTLRTAFERVYAVGDCTHIPNAAGALPKAGVFASGEARVAAHNLLVDLGLADDEQQFDGHGFCFLELPGEQVALVEGNFFAEPRPEVTLSKPTRKAWSRKVTYERKHLDLWLPIP